MGWRPSRTTSLKEYYFINGKIKKIKKIRQATLIKNKNKVDRQIYSIESCDNCGATIDFTKNNCEYCNTPIPKMNDWLLCEIK